MKKWLPYIIGLLIPAMIFISFAWMIKKRTFIFRDEFTQQAVLMMDQFEKEFQSQVQKDVIAKFKKIETKILENKEEELNVFLKNQVADSVILENIFITDQTLALKHSYAPYPANKLEELAWVVKNQAEGTGYKFFFLANSYLIYKDFKDKKIFLSMNPQFFYKFLKDKYLFLKENLMLTQKNWFLNFTENSYKNYLSFKELTKETELKTESGKKTVLEIKGDYIFGKKVVLKEEETPIWDFNFFAYIEPAHFPMSLWHRILLVVIAVIVIVMFLMLLFKVKNDAVLRQMNEYGSGNEDFLERNAMTTYENEMEAHAEDINELAEEEEGDEEYIEIPDEYFKKDNETVKKPNEDLTSLISEVKEHEDEVQKYNSLWKNIIGLVNAEPNRMILGLFNEETDELVPHFQKNIFPEFQINVEQKNWVIENFMLKGKALLVTQNAMLAKPIKDMFGAEYYTEVNSIFLAPVFDEEKNVKGIFLLFSSEQLEENKIREINSLIRMG